MEKKQISSIEEFEQLVKSDQLFLLFKNSLTCPISQQAFEEYDKFTKDFSLDTYYLHVQEARPLSNYVAEKFSIKHESPQVLLIKGKQVLWHDSHWNITYDQLQRNTTNK